MDNSLAESVQMQFMRPGRLETLYNLYKLCYNLYRIVNRNGRRHMR
jgi:hypothetical protein